MQIHCLSKEKNLIAVQYPYYLKPKQLPSLCFVRLYLCLGKINLWRCLFVQINFFLISFTQARVAFLISPALVTGCLLSKKGNFCSRGQVYHAIVFLVCMWIDINGWADDMNILFLKFYWQDIWCLSFASSSISSSGCESRFQVSSSLPTAKNMSKLCLLCLYPMLVVVCYVLLGNFVTRLSENVMQIYSWFGWSPWLWKDNSSIRSSAAVKQVMAAKGFLVGFSS